MSHPVRADYLILIGKDPQDGTSLHEHLHGLCRCHLPTDFELYGERERNAQIARAAAGIFSNFLAGWAWIGALAPMQSARAPDC